MIKTNRKKILSGFLAILIICIHTFVLGHSAVTAYNYGELQNSAKISNVQTYSSLNNFDTSLKQTAGSFSDDNMQEKNYVNYVAILQIFAWDGTKKKSNERGVSMSGHAFIVISNNTYSYINAGGLAIEKGTGITIGTFNFTDKHNGLWYGLEGYRYKIGDDDFEDRYSMTMKLTVDQLKKVNEIICKSDTWDVFNNCSTFATNVWNAVALEEDKLNAGKINNPSDLKKSIMNKGDKKYTVNAPIPTDYTPYYGNPPKKYEEYSE